MEHISQLRSVTRRMGSHSVTFHPTQVSKYSRWPWLLAIPHNVRTVIIPPVGYDVYIGLYNFNTISSTIGYHSNKWALRNFLQIWTREPANRLTWCMLTSELTEFYSRVFCWSAFRESAIHRLAIGLMCGSVFRLLRTWVRIVRTPLFRSPFTPPPSPLLVAKWYMTS